MNKIRVYGMNDVKVEKLNYFVKARFEKSQESDNYKKVVANLNTEKAAKIELRNNLIESIEAANSDEKKVTDLVSNDSRIIAYNDRIQEINTELTKALVKHQEESEKLRNRLSVALDDIIPSDMVNKYEGYYSKDKDVIVNKEELKKAASDMMEKLGFVASDNRPLRDFLEYINPVAVKRKGSSFVAALNKNSYKEYLASLICQYVIDYCIGYRLNTDASAIVCDIEK